MRRNLAAAFVQSLLAVLVMAAPPAMAQQAQPVETGNEFPWYVSLSLGYIDFEGDQDFDDSFLGTARLGYDFSELWTIEGALSALPNIKSNKIDGEERVDWSHTAGMGVAVEGLFHFTRWERLDPFLAAGVGWGHYMDDPVQGNQDEFQFRGGGGVMYHFNDEWALRADYRGMLADFGGSPNANSSVDGGVCWNWGARIPPSYQVTGGPLDSDGDGLLDSRELEIGTDPYDPDTDKDDLTDGEEVLKYTTNPLNPDTDMDLLKDGAEVHKYTTDPKKADTDNGGVIDGHEVLEDGTDPLNGKDDLFLIRLHIEFDTDQAVIKPEYFRQIDIVGKVLSRNVQTTTLIEGHADKRKTSGRRHNQRLSERRAKAVLDYLADKCGVDRARMKSEGYGFDRPIATNDPVNGNAMNRRTDVYIKGLEREKISQEYEKAKAEAASVAPASATAPENK